MGYSSGGGGSAGFPELGEPTGFFDRFQSTISFDPSSRVFTIAPVATSYILYFSATKITKTTPESITLPLTTGLHFIYFDADTKLLTSTMTFTEDLLTRHVYVSVIYWRLENASTVYFADERHGATMDGVTHIHLHSAFGAQYIRGLGLSNLNADASGDLASSSQFGVMDGVIRDEDLKFTIVHAAPQVLAPAAQIPVLYRIGADDSWYRTPATEFAFLNPLNAIYSNAGRPGYNVKNTNWQILEVPNNQYFLTHILATNDVDFPIVALAGGAYQSISVARDAALMEFKTFTGLPFTEFVLLATVILEASNTYASPTKSRIRKTADGFDYIDWRKANSFTTGAGGTSAAETVQQRTFAFFAS